MAPTVIAIEDTSFPERLSTLRKERGLTLQALAERIGIHVTQLRRYEAGTAQPTLDVLRRTAVSLSVSADTLVFDDNERGPADVDLRLHLEAIDHLDEANKAMVKALLDAQPHTWHPSSSPPPQGVTLTALVATTG